jgi:hypothetical protein
VDLLVATDLAAQAIHYARVTVATTDPKQAADLLQHAGALLHQAGDEVEKLAQTVRAGRSG